MRKAILMLLLAVVSNSTAAGWVEIGGSGALGGSTIYIDPATIRKNGNNVKMWELTDYKTAQENSLGVKSFLSDKLQTEYDCKKELLRALAFSKFSGNMGHGDVVYSNSHPQLWHSVHPQGVGKAKWKFACGEQ
jgi:hypothetical protein